MHLSAAPMEQQGWGSAQGGREETNASVGLLDLAFLLFPFLFPPAFHCT